MYTASLGQRRGSYWIPRGSESSTMFPTGLDSRALNHSNNHGAILAP